MEEEILSILLNMQTDITTIKNNQTIMKEDISGLKEDVSKLNEDMINVKEEQKNMAGKIDDLQKTVNSIQAEQRKMKKVQENILNELRINNLKLAKVTERFEIRQPQSHWL